MVLRHSPAPQLVSVSVTVTVTRVGVSACLKMKVDGVSGHTSLAGNGCDKRGDAEEDDGGAHVDC